LRDEGNFGAAEFAPLHDVRAAAVLLDLPYGKVRLDLGRRDVEIAFGRALVAVEVVFDTAFGAIAQNFDRLADKALRIVGKLFPVHGVRQRRRGQEQSSREHANLRRDRSHGDQLMSMPMMSITIGA
jgi:hypothetical protein